MNAVVRAAVSVLLALLVLAFAPAARADGAPPVAESLFKEGVRAMDEGDLARACALLADSHRIDPGGGAVLNLALCHERAGQLASAWARYHEGLAVARREARPDRIAFAERHIQELEGKVPHVRIALREPSSGTRVAVDGITLSAAASGAPVPVDPGDRVVTVDAPGMRPWTKTVRLSVGETVTVDVPPLVPARDAVMPLALPPPGDVRGDASGPRPARLVGYSMAGVGAAGLVAASVLGALTIGAESTADAACPESGPCADARGIEASNRARTYAGAATISGIAGAVLLASGIVVLFATR